MVKAGYEWDKEGQIIGIGFTLHIVFMVTRLYSISSIFDIQDQSPTVVQTSDFSSIKPSSKSKQTPFEVQTQQLEEQVQDGFRNSIKAV